MSEPRANPVAIVTGGTRGIGKGIASALAASGYDLLLAFNTNSAAAEEFAASLSCQNEIIGGDISLPETRDRIFACLDSSFPDRLAVMVHNAGQYIGLTSDNSDGLQSGKQLAFGDGSLLSGDAVNFDTMHYYQRMYGEAFVDLCERSLARMKGCGSLVGVSSVGVTSHIYRPVPLYSMPGTGKCIMEYAMRIYAAQAAARGISVNVVVPGITRTEAWEAVFKKQGKDIDDVFPGMVQQRVPMKKELLPKDIGDVVAFLCSAAGRNITGTVVPVDAGLHLKR